MRVIFYESCGASRGVLMNAGRIEYSRGEFYFYEEGVSSSVAKVIEKVDS